jgi:hypothetical protein
MLVDWPVCPRWSRLGRLVTLLQESLRAFEVLHLRKRHLKVPCGVVTDVANIAREAGSEVDAYRVNLEVDKHLAGSVPCRDSAAVAAFIWRSKLPSLALMVIGSVLPPGR